MEGFAITDPKRFAGQALQFLFIAPQFRLKRLLLVDSASFRPHLTVTPSPGTRFQPLSFVYRKRFNPQVTTAHENLYGKIKKPMFITICFAHWITVKVVDVI